MSQSPQLVAVGAILHIAQAADQVEQIVIGEFTIGLPLEGGGLNLSFGVGHRTVLPCMVTRL
jgi:hypothetical protein